jgi:hypothetical protein
MVDDITVLVCQREPRIAIALYKATREDFAAECRGCVDVAAGLLHDDGED